MKQASIMATLHDLVDGLYYVSESERPLEVLEWEVNNDEELRSQIAAFTGQPESALIQTGVAAFFESIQRMADPADEAMMEYAGHYSALRDFLENNLLALNMVKTGEIEVHVFITGFTPEEHKGIVLHTIAIQT